jgi:hypothetical protein
MHLSKGLGITGKKKKKKKIKIKISILNLKK